MVVSKWASFPSKLLKGIGRSNVVVVVKHQYCQECVCVCVLFHHRHVFVTEKVVT